MCHFILWPTVYKRCSTDEEICLENGRWNSDSKVIVWFALQICSWHMTLTLWMRCYWGFEVWLLLTGLIFDTSLLTQIPPRQPTGFPTLLGHLASSYLIHPLYVLPVKTEDSNLGSVFIPLPSPPPCDVHVVNLRTMQSNSMMPVAGSPQMAGNSRTALILHRTAIDCSFPLLQSVASCPVAGGKVIVNTCLRLHSH